MRRPVFVLLTALVGVALAPGPAGAATSSGSTEALGGPRLAGDGVVVDRDAPELPEGITASSFVLADLDSGQVLAAKGAHGRYAPASTLKTLTMLSLIPELERDELVTPTFDDVNVEGSKVGLVDDVAYPVHELFTALMSVSGNDAANALATAAGGQEAAAELMNDAAEGLQARDTRAVNPHGLDAEGQVSSAYDLALIARAGMADPQFAAYAATVKSSVSAPGGARIQVYTKNRLLKDYEGALGIKNGYTTRAGASFVGAAERDGRRLVVTLMRAEPRVADEAAKLLDWGFAAAAGVTPVGRLVDPLPKAAPLGPEAAAPVAAAVAR
ncbi:MAG: serine hydrolase, partial [Frankiaceae bacterium]|nr:serine hydrolase [Frankiaceae bacterium]